MPINATFKLIIVLIALTTRDENTCAFVRTYVQEHASSVTYDICWNSQNLILIEKKKRETFKLYFLSWFQHHCSIYVYIHFGQFF